MTPEASQCQEKLSHGQFAAWLLVAPAPQHFLIDGSHHFGGGSRCGIRPTTRLPQLEEQDRDYGQQANHRL
jgi:hypothetical protein